MHRTAFALLLLSATLPMAAEEGVKVTVHQAEWGDTRGEAPPPSGPKIPSRASDSTPAFRSTSFNYGRGLRYGTRYANWGDRYGLQLRYMRGTMPRNPYREMTQSQFLLNRRYDGTGNLLRNGYQPNIDYGSNMPRRNRRYGFNR